MLKCCTKFRLFNLLVLFGVINILVFRSYFTKGLVRVSTSYDVNVTSSSSDGVISNDVNAVSEAAARAQDGHRTTQKAASPVNSSVAAPAVATTASGAGANASHAGGGRQRGAGWVMDAWGREVVPRANVTAPWKPSNDSTTLPLCPLVPPNLVGPLATYKEAVNWTEIVRLNPGLEPGGHYQPTQCQARHRVAVVVPYRDRETHLRILLHNLHPMLMRQQLDYFVLVLELALPTKFNRGLLLNIGAVEALGLRDVHCFVFHDVDLVPENDRNLYTCPQSPRHMSAAVDKFKYKLPYQRILGGAMAISREHFYQVNGYSNVYFGWGGEDDDLMSRVKGAGLKISRYSMDVARYKMIKHNRDKNNEPNPQRHKMLRTFKNRQPNDGLNSLQYTVEKVSFLSAYTHIVVSVNQSAILKTTN